MSLNGSFELEKNVLIPTPVSDLNIFAEMFLYLNGCPQETYDLRLFYKRTIECFRTFGPLMPGQIPVDNCPTPAEIISTINNKFKGSLH